MYTWIEMYIDRWMNVDECKMNVEWNKQQWMNVEQNGWVPSQK
jgi:hypothetical protein